MTDLQKFQRAARVFLARRLIIHGTDAPHVLRRIADELEWLEEDATSADENVVRCIRVPDNRE